MMHALLQRLRKAGAPEPEAPATGRTIVREERGGGAGAVLFQPYQVEEFQAGEARPVRAAAPVSRDRGETAPAPQLRAPNTVADEWRRQSPTVFRTVAERYCARAPKVAEELRTLCLSGQTDKLAHLADSLKPTLSLFDMTAADAADRLKQAATDGSAELALSVLALEHEVWRVMAAWQQTPPQTAGIPPEVAS
jgi:hypothetical protein